MNVKSISMLPTEKYMAFGISVGKPIKKVYYPNCWNEISNGKYKDFSFTIYNNYEFGNKCSTLIVVKKMGAWIKSNLKYRDVDGSRKVLWSYNQRKEQH